MEPPSKRARPSPPRTAQQNDYISLSTDNDTFHPTASKYGYNNTSPAAAPNSISARPPNQIPFKPTYNSNTTHSHSHPHSSRAYLTNPTFLSRHAKDRPQSAHPLRPPHEPWMVVYTRFGRRFVYDPSRGVSLWRAPPEVWRGVREFEARRDEEEGLDREREENQLWAEERLGEMRGLEGRSGGRSGREVVGEGEEGEEAQGESRGPRRRSESLQREDEEAMMAELAAEAEREGDAGTLSEAQPRGVQAAAAATYDSDSSYEEVEVTDSEFDEDEDNPGPPQTKDGTIHPSRVPHFENENDNQDEEDLPVEFGEEDIAYQLAAMASPNALDAVDDDSETGDYDPDLNTWGSGGEDSMTAEEGQKAFFEMLDAHEISPFTPWESLISATCPLLSDARFTVLASAKARKKAWEHWCKLRAAAHQIQRATREKANPRVAFLELVQAQGRLGLYWAEFKRKVRKDAAMADRGLGERDKERMYRDYVGRLKLEERVREADLRGLLGSVPRGDSKGGMEGTERLPEVVRADVKFYGVDPTKRERIIAEVLGGGV